MENGLEKQLDKSTTLENGWNVPGDSQFLYDTFACEAKILALLDDNHQPVTHLNDDGYVVLDKTPFYATAGGQLHDIGVINKDIIVDDVIKVNNGTHIHHVINAHLTVNDFVKAELNESQRQKLSNHHSAEHLLGAACMNILGKTFKQVSAFKYPEKFTFEFEYPEKLTDGRLKDLTDWINEQIQKHIPITTLEMSLAEAKAIGAGADFENVYEQIDGNLRVIKIGDISLELCGGTHAHNTADLETFVITEYYAKNSKIWRIDALTGNENYQTYLTKEQQKYVDEIISLKNEFKAAHLNEHAIDELCQEFWKTWENTPLWNHTKLFNQLKKQVSEVKTNLRKEQIQKNVEFLKAQFTAINADKKLIVLHGDFIEDGAITTAIYDLSHETADEQFAVLVNGVKLRYFIGTNQDVTKARSVNLNTLAQSINAVCVGRGGGKPSCVSGGSAQTDKLNDIITVLSENGFTQH